MTPPSAAAARARSAAAPAHAPLRQPLAPSPRRVSGPERHPRALPLEPRRGALGRLLDAPFLDRLIRGRIWIAIIAFALLGIVAMQVAILQLGASIGHSVTEISQLTASNQAAETAIAQDEPGRDVSSEAASLGMVYPPAGNIVYLHYSTADGAAAAGSITLPTAPLFTPAAASLTQPILPATSSDTTTSAATTTTASSDTTTTAAGTTADPATAPTTTSGGAAGAPDTPSTSTDLGAGGGSTAPGG